MDVVVDKAGDGGITVVRPAGDLDLATASVLQERLGTLLDEGHRRIVLDLSEVAFIDSTGIGALVGAYKQAQDLGASLALASPQPPVGRVFDLTGLRQLVSVADTVNVALETLGS